MDEQPALERRMQLDLRAFVNSLLKAKWVVSSRNGENLLMSPPWNRNVVRDIVLYPRTRETYNGKTYVVAAP